MIIKKYFFRLFLSVIILVFFSSSVFAENSLKIIAASDLRYAMNEIINEFKLKNKNTKIDVIYASSGNAFSQISSNAPYDIFFSADIKYTEQLKEKGLAITKPKLYGIGQIVLWSKKIDISKKDMFFLNTDEIKKIAIANPKHAPYGKKAIESLKYYKLFDKIEKKLIYGENISQSTQFVDTGNAEICITAFSLLSSANMKNKGYFFVIPEKSYSPLKQGYILLKNAQDNKLAKSFYDFIDSIEVKNILKKYGFKVDFK
ncbi:MAG: molybdate ABC transporter substrate-binding protein [Cyanobacteriota bacterium]